MSLKGKVAIVTGGNSGIGKSIVLALAEQGANIVIDYVAHPDATEELEKQIVALGDQAIGVDADVSKVADLQTPDRRAVQGVRPRRHHGQQRRHRDPHLDPRHDRSAVREGARDQPQERVLRHADRGQADDRAGRRRPDHQHHLGARRLADAGQHAPTACRRAACGCSPAPPVSSSRRTASSSSASDPARSRRRSTVDDGRSREDEDARRGHSARPHGRAATRSRSVVAFLAGDGASYLTATTIFADGGIMHSSPGL